MTRHVLAALALLLPLAALAASVQVPPLVCGHGTNGATYLTPTIGTTASNIPAAPMTGREWVDVCNSIDNGTTPIVTCRADGIAPANLGAGVKLARGDCYRFGTSQDTVITCIADTAATVLTVNECRRAD